MNTPVLFIIFNRPDTTIQVFEAIRRARPPRLYVSADGPRTNRPNEAVKCAEARAIIDKVDWSCEVFTNFRDENVGCRIGVSSGIDWFFENEPEGIILEDDCLPDPTFFSFCENLLDHYRHDERVSHISGNNWQFGIERGDGSYYFSRYPHIWGWATWRRVWQKFSLTLPNYEAFDRLNYFAQIFPEKRVQRYWRWKFDQVHSGAIKSAWSYEYLYSTLINNGLCINPNVNLVSNIGYGVEGANVSAVSKRNIMAFVPVGSIPEIRHPNFMLHDTSADTRTFDKIFSPPLWIKARNRIMDYLDKN